MDTKLDIDKLEIENFGKSSHKKFAATTLNEEAIEVNKSEVEKKEAPKPFEGNPLMMKVIEQISGKEKATRLAFVENPVSTNSYSGIYKLKNKLIPDSAIKDIRVNCMLVAAILRGRGNTLSMFGKKRKDRFDVGFELNVKPEFKECIEPEQMAKIQERMDLTTNLILSCGHTDGMKDDEKMTLSEFLNSQGKNGLSFGRFSTEFIYNNQGKFSYFRPADVGTIYKTVKKGETAVGIREQALVALEYLTGDKVNTKLSKDRFEQDEYAWVQVIDGTPKQAFTAKEMVVTNLFPSTDIEHNGYPVTPLDTVLNSLTTFMSIETYTRLYFQNGRASKGMLVLSSDEVDQAAIEDIKQQFMASINNVSNSFRTPLFGVGKDDEIKWVPTESNAKDGEFQFLFDQVTRNILSAFSMSPDELAGFSHLSKGTNNQGLSESSNEYKMTAQRDLGIRPLIMQIEEFLNNRLLTAIDPELAQLCSISLSGLDAEDKQQESTRLAQQLPLYYDYDSVMSEVKKEAIGTHLGGKVPFNERVRVVFDNYIEVGKLMGQLLESPAAYVDPMLKYKRDQFFTANIQLMAQYNPIAVKAYYATNPARFDLLKELLKDYLEDLDNE
jgi:hypothetical protein